MNKVFVAMLTLALVAVLLSHLNASPGPSSVTQFGISEKPIPPSDIFSSAGENQVGGNGAILGIYQVPSNKGVVITDFRYSVLGAVLTNMNLIKTSAAGQEQVYNGYIYMQACDTFPPSGGTLSRHNVGVQPGAGIYFPPGSQVGVQSPAGSSAINFAWQINGYYAN